MLFGQGGVDLFFFLSGFGLAHSKLRFASPWQFYKKRLLRIFPPFLLVLFIRCLASPSLGWKSFLWGATTLPYWFPSIRRYTFGWFVSVILALYALFPAYIRIFTHRRKEATASAVMLGLAMVAAYAYYFLIVHPGSYNQYILSAARIPIFFIGIYAGSLSQRAISEKSNSRSSWHADAISLLFFLSGLVMWNAGLDIWGFMPMRNSGLLYLLFVPMMPGILSIATHSLQTVSQQSCAGKAICHLLRQMGSCTLEAYLLLGTTYAYVYPLSKTIGCTPFCANALLAIATIFIAWLIHKAIEQILLKVHIIAGSWPFYTSKRKGV